MAEDKICPLLATTPNQAINISCKGLTCAWWNEPLKKCSMHVLAESIRGIEIMKLKEQLKLI